MTRLQISATTGSLAVAMAASLVMHPGIDQSTIFTALTAEGLGLLCVLTYLTFMDLKEFRLPNIATYGLIGAGLIKAIITTDMALIIASLIGVGVGYGVIASLRTYYMIRRGVEGIGLGDAKLVAAAGAWFGWSALPALLLLSSASALLFFAVIYSVRSMAHENGRKIQTIGQESSQKIPFGPYLAASFWIIWWFYSADLSISENLCLFCNNGLH